MKCHSNIPIGTFERWKDGEYVYYVNHLDNGIQFDENTGKRYEADFTIVKEQTAESIINSFTRMTDDPILEQKVVDNIQVDGKPAIEVKKEYLTKVSTIIFPSLPSSGDLKKGEVYSYNNGAVMVVQDHKRTIYTPEETPALFSFYRDNIADLAWIEGEKVEVGWTRTYGGKVYTCLQAHQTQSDWTPDKASALWKEKVVVVDIPVWKQPIGAHDAYKKGDKVYFPTDKDLIYESLIDANVWSPTVYPAGWKKI